MNTNNLPDYLKEAQCVFQGTRVSLCTIQLPGKSGEVLQKEVVVHPGAVAILPVVDEETIILIKNERFAVNQELWELPAGTLEQGELPKETAQRELLEETGYYADHLELLTNFYTTPGFTNEIIYSYLATNLHYAGQHLDDSEQITVHQIKWTTVMDMIKKGEILDGKTIATLLYYRTFR